MARLLTVLFLFWLFISYFPFTEIEIKRFLMRIAILLASFGLSFFIIAHLQFIPIADRMLRNHEKVREKTEKSRKFVEKDVFIFRRSTVFPRRKVFAT